MISIRFIRSDDVFSNNGHKDDRVTITSIGADQYNLIFTTPTLKGPQTLTLTDREVFRWMRVVLGLLEADGEPFAEIQIDQHAMPSALLPAARVYNGIICSTISQHYHRILNAVEFFLDTATPCSKECNYAMDVDAVTTSMDEDEDEDEDEDADADEYADMPPLIPPPGARHLFFDDEGNLERAYF